MPTLQRRLEQWLGLAPWERLLLLRVLVLLPAIGAALRLLGFNRTRALLEGTAPAQNACLAGGPTGPAARTQPIARVVAIAARRGPYRATCLRESLALWWLLRRRGIPAELRIGVRKEGVALLAHAWVEQGGAPLGMGPLGHSPFPRLSSPSMMNATRSTAVNARRRSPDRAPPEPPKRQ
jgi:hypothetical protein